MERTSIGKFKMKQLQILDLISKIKIVYTDLICFYTSFEPFNI